MRTHDFIDRDLGKAIPYGVYDLTNNEGWVNVGIDHDTAEFAVSAMPNLAMQADVLQLWFFDGLTSAAKRV